jgi:hypothetical protein
MRWLVVQKTGFKDAEKLTAGQSKFFNLCSTGGTAVAMTTPVQLENLIDALDEQGDTVFAFLDRDSGQIELVSEEALSHSESEQEEIYSLPDWQKEEVELAVRIQSSDRFLALPSKFDVHEWSIMERFCHEIKRDDIRTKLLDAIHGSGAFRRFKDQIAHFDLWEPWNAFRHHAFGEILTEWCEENGIALAAAQKQSAGH